MGIEVFSITGSGLEFCKCGKSLQLKLTRFQDSCLAEDPVMDNGKY